MGFKSVHRSLVTALVIIAITISIQLSFYKSNTLVLAGWEDPQTPKDKRTILSYSDINNDSRNDNDNDYNNVNNKYKTYELVMSDEFNVDKRNFKDGSDPMWTGLDKSDDDQTSSGKRSLQFYNRYRTIKNI